ncbi:L-rhamnose mutarotase [Microbacterium sp. 179-I 3D3 NHS]|uniref:L-rhamnose mutarotase n=1 Tax=unclassified Microbacterium TaxID=2609290 RepID=UPI0039A16929
MAAADEQLCLVYRLRPGAGAEYDRRHRDILPGIVEMMSDAGFYDYSIFRRGELVITTFRTRAGFREAEAACQRSPLQAIWGASLAHLFEEVADAAGEPLWAPRVFRIGDG